MTKKRSGQKVLQTLVISGSLLAGAWFLSACAGEPPPQVPEPAKETHTTGPLVSSYTINVPSPQEAVYDGEPHPLSFTFSGEPRPEVVYYPSAPDRDADRYGSYAPPIQAGTYYVRISLPGEDIYGELRILRRPVTIAAAAFQQAVYDGNPKRVEAAVQPPVPLSYSYYPNRELRDAAINAAEEINQNEDFTRSLTETFRGYKRVERAPIELGTYYVWIYFPGDENNKSAQANVEFTIVPPPGVTPRQK
ncbi:MAG: hypothetical protein FWC45_03085 [Treponema sp.]|nr:hypothetical protein [Treponema sp.]